jgi:hypothetical protein
MVSIAESMRGLNGDGWGTTLSKEEQMAHLEYVKKNFDELDREKEMAEMRAEMGLDSETDHDSHLSSMKTNFIEGFLPKEKHSVDSEVFKHIIDEIKSKHSEDMKNLRDLIASMSVKVSELQEKVSKLEVQVVELSKPRFFGRIFNYFSCLGRS